MIRSFVRSREAILLGALIALVLLVESRFSGFASPGNLAAGFNDTAILIMLALGQMLVILTRCIDLSLASNLALTGMVTAMLNAAVPGLPVAVRVEKYRQCHRNQPMLPQLFGRACRMCRDRLEQRIEVLHRRS